MPRSTDDAPQGREGARLGFRARDQKAFFTHFPDSRNEAVTASG
jgi:hypothetical protein